jgi:hypothetical protein
VPDGGVRITFEDKPLLRCVVIKPCVIPCFQKPGVVSCAWFYAGVQGVPDGGVRITFEDKPLLSDIVFPRAWVAVDIPQLHNTAVICNI